MQSTQLAGLEYQPWSKNLSTVFQKKSMIINMMSTAMKLSFLEVEVN